MIFSACFVEIAKFFLHTVNIFENPYNSVFFFLGVFIPAWFVLMVWVRKIKVDAVKRRQIVSKIILQRVGKVFGANICISFCCFFLMQGNILTVNLIFLGVQIFDQTDLLKDWNVDRGKMLFNVFLNDYAAIIRNQVFPIHGFFIDINSVGFISKISAPPSALLFVFFDSLVGLLIVLFLTVIHLTSYWVLIAIFLFSVSVYLWVCTSMRSITFLPPKKKVRKNLFTDVHPKRVGKKERKKNEKNVSKKFE
jgi:hypothetical protein